MINNKFEKCSKKEIMNISGISEEDLNLITKEKKSNG
jgi:hypothetical protein